LSCYFFIPSFFDHFFYGSIEVTGHGVLVEDFQGGGEVAFGHCQEFEGVGLGEALGDEGVDAIDVRGGNADFFFLEVFL